VIGATWESGDDVQLLAEPITDETLNPFSIATIAVFAVGYLAIAFENITRINKTAAALMTGIVCWVILYAGAGHFSREAAELTTHISSISQIIFFLIGAMTIVELIDSHHGFQLIVDLIHTRSKVKILWVVGAISFFVSSALDNLTTTIVMVSLLRKIIPDRAERWFYGSIVVVAANAGGAWTPIGDLTTTMLWINGNITTLSVIRHLFLPSVISVLVSLIYASFILRKLPAREGYRETHHSPEPGARLAFFVGVGALIFVPIFKALTGLPPFMGMLIGVAALWLVTDLWHYGHHDRDHLKIPHALTRIDTSSVLFFLGILLAVGALDAGGILRDLGHWIDAHIFNPAMIALLIGFGSAIVDNVPLVAATISMYDLSRFPVDAPFWNLVAYCAGTGGSMLIIGSAAGVALMGLEKVDFFWYLRKISLVAIIGYLAGAGLYIVQQML
jgi:NhaD family Na+/H+ antiporter